MMYFDPQSPIKTNNLTTPQQQQLYSTPPTKKKSVEKSYLQNTPKPKYSKRKSLLQELIQEDVQSQKKQNKYLTSNLDTIQEYQNPEQNKIFSGQQQQFKNYNNQFIMDNSYQENVNSLNNNTNNQFLNQNNNNSFFPTTTSFANNNTVINNESTLNNNNNTTNNTNSTTDDEQYKFQIVKICSKESFFQKLDDSCEFEQIKLFNTTTNNTNNNNSINNNNTALANIKQKCVENFETFFKFFNEKDNNILQLFAQGATIEILGEKIYNLNQTLIAMAQNFSFFTLSGQNMIELDTQDNSIIISNFGNAKLCYDSQFSQDFQVSIKFMQNVNKIQYIILRINNQ